HTGHRSNRDCDSFHRVRINGHANARATFGRRYREARLAQRRCGPPLDGLEYLRDLTFDIGFLASDLDQVSECGLREVSLEGFREVEAGGCGAPPAARGLIARKRGSRLRDELGVDACSDTNAFYLGERESPRCGLFLHALLQLGGAPQDERKLTIAETTFIGH